MIRLNAINNIDRKYRKTIQLWFDLYHERNSIDNFFGASEGISKAVGDGYYVITEPLAKGTYTIKYKSSLICPGTDCLEPNFAQDITYTIIAQ